MKFNIGIIGNGFVGGATKLLKCLEINILVWDIIPEKSEPQNLKISDLKVCDFIFICVPTPMEDSGNCHIGIVEKVVKKLKEPENKIDTSHTTIVIRSTVPPGTSKNLECYFMPEFLTEANWEQDFINCKNWIFGINPSETEVLDKFVNLIKTAYKYQVIKYDNVIGITTDEAEMVKYTRNSFLATKISYFNEINQLCQSLNINYKNVRRVTCLDSRIGESHTKVPGHDNHYGFGGTCLPKDIHALAEVYQATLNIKPPVLSAIIYRNDNIDRPEKDWAEDKRAKLN